MKVCNSRYCNLRTISEVREERNKVELRLQFKELELKQDMEIIKERFSWSSIYSLAMGKLYMTSSMVRKAVDGFNLVKGFLTRRRARRNDPCGCR